MSVRFQSQHFDGMQDNWWVIFVQEMFDVFIKYLGITLIVSGSVSAKLTLMRRLFGEWNGLNGRIKKRFDRKLLK